jgi:hypothetical protein
MFRALGVAITSLLVVSGLAVSAANANGTYDPGTGSGTVTCSGGGSVTVISFRVTDGTSCVGEVDLPEGITKIGDEATVGPFYTATSLTAIRIPSTVELIGPDAFKQASALTTVTFAADSSLTTIFRDAFQAASSLVSIEIPSRVTSIGDNAFARNPSLASISLPEGLISLGQMVFWDATSLTSIDIPASVTSIGSGAFYDATSLSTIRFAEGSNLETIQLTTFWNTALTSITIPAAVVSIEDSAFYWSYSLTTFRFLGNAPVVHMDAFSEVGPSPKALINYSATGFGDEPTWNGLTLERAENPSRSSSPANMKAQVSPLPKLMGVAKVAKTLNAVQGQWTGHPTPTLTYKWYACGKKVKAARPLVTKSCKPIRGATGDSFKLTAKQRGKFVSVLVTGTSIGTSSTSWLTKSSARVKQQTRG